jgi:hypothetical protein
MINTNFAILGALLPFLGSISYAKDTLSGRTKPNLVSWSMWTLAPMIAFAAELTQHVGLQSLLAFAVGFGPFIVLIAAFISHKAYWKITKFDLICGIFSSMALLLWAITGKGDVAILFSILSDLSAAIPTIIKAYKAPETESAGAFSTSILGGIITLLTIKHFVFANYAFTLYVTIVASVITLFVLLGIKRNGIQR